jgi:hypothetical protein
MQNIKKKLEILRIIFKCPKIFEIHVPFVEIISVKNKNANI